MIGSGKYDQQCTQARNACEATGVVLIVYDGKAGSGFSVQMPAPEIFKLSAAFRELADELDKTLVPQ